MISLVHTTSPFGIYARTAYCQITYLNLEDAIFRMDVGSNPTEICTPGFASRPEFVQEPKINSGIVSEE